MTDLCEDKKSWMLATAYNAFVEMVEEEAYCERCESPIEQLISAAFYISSLVGSRIADTSADFYCHGWNYSNVFTSKNIFDYAVNGRINIFPQVEIGEFRVDFMCLWILSGSPFLTPVNLSLAVECDGHEFHEKTKEQAARDKRRDRIILMSGIPTVRFTGSEIYEDPFKCVAEVGELMWARMESHMNIHMRGREIIASFEEVKK